MRHTSSSTISPPAGRMGGDWSAIRRLLPYLSMDERDALTASAIELRDVARSLGY